jgi:uncharacterized repeat protein (TIGR01451 family)
MEARMLLATITVTDTGDAIALDGVVTLREAITAANTNAASGDAPAGEVGLDTIAFNIPGTGVHTIRPSPTTLPTITDPVTIDGYTQPGASPNTNPTTAASNAVLLIELDGSAITSGDFTGGLRITAGSSTVRGLVINRFNGRGLIVEGGGSVIAGNYIGTNPAGTAGFDGAFYGLTIQSSNNTIGGTSPADRNILSASNFGHGLLIANNSDGTPTSGIVVQGNFIGTDATGTVDLGNLGEGVYVAGPSGVTIGGTVLGARNIISGNGGFGLTLQGIGALVQGNLIGTDITGSAKLGNGAGISTAMGATIGGTTPGAGNVISGNNSIGILNSFSPGILIQGNFIGTDVTATIDLGNGEGIDLIGSNNNTIGGTTPGAGNVIAFSKGGGFNADGVAVDGTGNSILGNSIFENGNSASKGIRYTNLVVEPPVLTSATATSIAGTLRGPATTKFRVEFFATPVTGSTATAQGKTFLGATDATTDGAGNASFTFSPPGGVPAAQYLTATATDPGSTTSEFSAALTIQATAATADLAVGVSDAPDPVAAGTNLAYTILVTNHGPDAAQNLALTTAVPVGTTFVSFTAPAGWTATNPAAGGTGTVSATAASLGAGGAGPAAFTLVVQVAPSAAGSSTLNLVVQIAATTDDPTTANNSATESTTVATATTTNTAPIAAADTYGATAGIALTVPVRGVLGNDADAENTALAAVIETQPGHGALTLNADGSFTFTPAAGFSGTDTFTYRASDGQLTSAPATVTFNVAAAVLPPVDTIPSVGTNGPRVTGLLRFGFHAQPTRLVLTFDKSLAVAAARAQTNYRLVAAGRDGRFGTHDDVAIALRRATYDPISGAVILATRHPLPLRRQYRLTVRAAQGGLTDLTSKALNSNANGTPGGDAVVRFNQKALAGPSVVNSAAKGPLPTRFRRYSHTVANEILKAVASP